MIRFYLFVFCLSYCASVAQVLHSWQTPMARTCFINGFIPLGNELYVAVNNTGVFSKQADSQYWETQNSGLPPYAYLNIHSNGTTVYTFDFYGSVYKRSDRNSAWQLCPPFQYTVTGTDSSIHVYNLFTTTNNTTYASTSRGVYVLENNNWNHINTDFDGRVLLQRGAVLFGAGTNSGVFRSDDNGQTWKEQNNGLNIKDLVNNRDYTPYVSSLISEGNTIIAGCVEGFFRSVNNGATWVRTAQQYGNIGPMCNGNNASVWCGSANVLLRSDDSGRTWNTIPTLSIPTDRRISALYSSGNTVYVGCGHSGNWNDFVGGLFLSTDNGSSWSEVSTPSVRSYVGLDTTYYPTCYGSDSLYWYVGSTADGIYRSPDKGRTWSQTQDTLRDPITAIVSHNGVVYAGTADGLYYSTNNGNQWHFAPHTTPTTYHTIYGVTVVRDTVVALTRNGTWIITGTDTSRMLKLFKVRLNEFIHVATIRDTMYVATDKSLYYSGDIGRTWAELRNTTGTLGTITGMTNNGVVTMLSTTKGVLQVTGDSTQWIARNTGLTIDGVATQPLVTSITHFAKHLYASIFSETYPEKSGVYQSTDNGLTWYPANDGLTHRSIVSLTVIDSVLLAAVDSKEMPSCGVWWLQLPYSPLTDVAETETPQQSTLALFPHPANNALTITTPDGTPITLTVYNVNGKLMYEQEITMQSSIVLNTSQFANGCYLAVLHSRRGVQSQTFIVQHY
ncbi:MAG: T9SS type A sorting domain-containing protein [Bacteriodetes bacterium]|nr:T9SS type A sorting domain-containing protein [Bacteroidota bacterium]